MKDKQTYSRDYSEQLARFLGGEMDEEQQKSFLEEADRAGNLHGLEELGKQWNALGRLRKPDSPDTGKAWEKVSGRLQQEQLVPHFRLKRRNPWLLPVSVAAACLILAGIGLLVRMQTSQSQAPEMITVSTANEPGTLVKPLADGSVICIAQNSVLSYPVSFEKRSREVTLKGEAFFDIAADASKPFVIETEEASIRVIGTAFSIRSGKKEGFELSVLRGKVLVTLKSDPSQRQAVGVGEKVITRDHTLVKSKHGSGKDWFRQRIRFKDERLADIIRVLNRNFSTNFAVDNPSTGNRKLTVAFQGNSAREMAELICLSLNLKSRNLDGAVVFTENRE